MTGRRLTSHVLSIAGLCTLLGAAPAQAGHLVWIDFSGFDLSDFPTVNGNTPPTAADVSGVRNTVVANMVEDWAHADIHFTTVQPGSGRYTRLRFLKGSNGLLYGTSDNCSVDTNCGGIGSWQNALSAAEVYNGLLPGDPSWQGSGATTARIANQLSHTASHELGHVLGLTHCHAGDDFVSSGTTCGTNIGPTNDTNVSSHVMANQAAGLTSQQRATLDRFFNAHSERRVLLDALQAANHWSNLGDASGEGRADLAFLQRVGASGSTVAAGASNGSSFNALALWSGVSGGNSDFFYRADVTGDGRADWVFGRPTSASATRWFVQRSTGATFGGMEDWALDRGQPGNIYRFADVNGDLQDDLIFGQVLSASEVQWYVALSNGATFDPSQSWIGDAGNRNSLFLLGDVTGDGRADLVVVDRGVAQGIRVYRSTGSSFLSAVPTNVVINGQYVHLGDVTGDGRADLVYGQVKGDFQVDWYVRSSNGCSGPTGCYAAAAVPAWVVDAGDAGDYFRLGDGNGDGRLDLFYARPNIWSLTATPAPNTITWYGRLSMGSFFAGYTTWSADLGNDGDLVP